MRAINADNGKRQKAKWLVRGWVGSCRVYAEEEVTDQEWLCLAQVLPAFVVTLGGAELVGASSSVSDIKFPALFRLKKRLRRMQH